MILVLAGTRDATDITRGLLEKGIDVTATAATAYGAELLCNACCTDVICGRYDTEGLEELIGEKKARVVVDATHPYAATVSQNAICACERTGATYIRYEREGGAYPDAVHVDTYQQACSYLEKREGNVLVTTGTNNIGAFVPLIRKSRVVARVLPCASSLEKCAEAGLGPDSIIAMKGPFSKEMNKAIIKECDISFLVTKDGGAQGGTPEKIDACRECGVCAVMIDRPHVNYPRSFGSVEKTVCEAAALIGQEYDSYETRKDRW